MRIRIQAVTNSEIKIKIGAKYKKFKNKNAVNILTPRPPRHRLLHPAPPRTPTPGSGSVWTFLGSWFRIRIKTVDPKIIPVPQNLHQNCSQNFIFKSTF